MFALDSAHDSALDSAHDSALDSALDSAHDSAHAIPILASTLCLLSPQSNKFNAVLSSFSARLSPMTQFANFQMGRVTWQTSAVCHTAIPISSVCGTPRERETLPGQLALMSGIYRLPHSLLSNLSRCVNNIPRPFVALKLPIEFCSFYTFRAQMFY